MAKIGEPADDRSRSRSPRSRQASDEKMHDWKAEFTQCTTVKSFVENIGNVVDSAHFKIVHEPEFQGMKTQTLNANQTVMVRGHLRATVKGVSPGENKEFCIRVSQLQTCLNNAEHSQFLTLSQLMGHSMLCVHIYEPEVNSGQANWLLPTLHEEPVAFEIDKMEYTLVVEINMSSLKKVIRTAKDHKADSLQIQVYEPRSDAQEGIAGAQEARKAQRKTWVIFEYRSETGAHGQYPYVSHTEELVDNGQHFIQIIDSTDFTGSHQDPCPETRDGLKCTYKGTFNTEQLSKFVRGVERHAARLHLKQGHPLILRFALGDEESEFVEFILAPKDTDNDELPA